jgi:hypothetical protein
LRCAAFLATVRLFGDFFFIEDEVYLKNLSGKQAFVWSQSSILQLLQLADCRAEIVKGNVLALCGSCQVSHSQPSSVSFENLFLFSLLNNSSSACL